MNKLNNKSVIKIALSIVVGLAGLLTVIFSILNLAGVKEIHSSDVFKVLIGVLLIIIGASTSLFTIFANKESRAFDLISGAVFIGTGIFLFVQNELSVIIGIMFPLVIACFGGLLFAQSIVAGVNKTNNRFVLNLIVGICLLVAGILFTIYHDKLEPVLWLLLGLAVIVLAIGEIVFTLKGRTKAKIVNQ